MREEACDASPRTSVRAARALSYLARRAPVRHAVVVALPPRPDPRPAARARPPDPAVDLVRPSAAAVDRGAHQLGGRLERARCARPRRPSPSRRHGESRASQSASASHMFPIPATSDWSSSASPNQREPSARTQPREHLVDVAAAARGCPGRAGRARACAARARGRSRGRPRPTRRAARATACRCAARRAAAASSARSCAGASARRRRPRSGAAGSCRARSPIRAPCRRSARRSARPGRGDAGTRRRPAGRRSPAGAGPPGEGCRPRARCHGNECGRLSVQVLS